MSQKSLKFLITVEYILNSRSFIYLFIYFFLVWWRFFGRVLPDVFQGPTAFPFIIEMKALGLFLSSGTACITKRHNRLHFSTAAYCNYLLRLRLQTVNWRIFLWKIRDLFHDVLCGVNVLKPRSVTKKCNIQKLNSALTVYYVFCIDLKTTTTFALHFI